MRYESFEYLWPPRPENAIQKSTLGFYEREGWIAQAKLNGACNVMAVAPDGLITAMNRHKEPHSLWKPSERTEDAFINLPGNGWYVFVAELLHSKVVTGPKDTNYINDILVADSEYLVGTTLAERQSILEGLFNIDLERSTLTHHVIDEHTWLARNHSAGFAALWDALDGPIDEGLVLKNPRAKLVMCSRGSANSNWQVKCRRSTKNYGF